MPWFLKHYSAFAEKVYIFLEPSSDSTDQIVKSFPKAELRKYPHRGLDDNRFIEAASSWYKESRGKADWVAWVDCDELLWHDNILSVLEKADGDIFPSTGYALISRNGWPDSKGQGQIYDSVKTGVRQANYDKKILFRPSLDIEFAIGRHTYANPAFPKHNGKECSDVGIKLLHCHCLGGTEETAQRNRRNYARATDKKNAWNFSDAHNNNPKQSGAVAWVKDILDNNCLIDVFTGQPVAPTVPAASPPSTDRLPMVPSPTPAQRPPALKKVQFGSGGNKLDGWLNLDLETDIRKKLPFTDGSVSHIYGEHCLEHISHQESWNFFSECHRILAKGGVLRIAIPDFTKLEREMIPEYQAAVKAGGHGDGTKQSSLKAVVFSHGHRSVWNSALLRSFLKAVGFSVSAPAYGESSHSALVGVENHWRAVGRKVAENETSCVEGVKQ